MHQIFQSPIARRATRIGLLAVAASLWACGSTAPALKPKPSRQQSEPAPAAPATNAAFIRPAPGSIISRYNGNTNKGIDIAGTAGEPVIAAADGRVIIVSDALRAMGTMMVVRHNETLLTAYAHLGRTLVKEGDAVRQGQPLAEMGQSGTDRVKLHFEIRKNGVAQDPEPYLSGKLR